MNLFHPVMTMHETSVMTSLSCFADLKGALVRSAEAGKLGPAGLKNLFYAKYFASFADTLLSGWCWHSLM